MLALCAELGIGPAEAKKLLIAPPDAKTLEASLDANVQDAEFEDVEPERELTDEERAAEEKRERDNASRRIRRAMTPEERKARRAQMRSELSARMKAKAEQRSEGSSEGLEDLLGETP